MQITYNMQNLAGAGCYEPRDTGLSGFGREIVAETNRVGVFMRSEPCRCGDIARRHSRIKPARRLHAHFTRGPAAVNPARFATGPADIIRFAMLLIIAGFQRREATDAAPRPARPSVVGIPRSIVSDAELCMPASPRC